MKGRSITYIDGPNFLKDSIDNPMLMADAN